MVAEHADWRIDSLTQLGDILLSVQSAPER